SVQRVQLEGMAPFRVPCESRLAGRGWMMVQQRTDNNIDFEQNWATYRRGFGDLYGSFFIGLEKLHRLTSVQPHELYVHLVSFEGRTTQAHYDRFRVEGEAQGYRLAELGEYQGGAGDAGDALSDSLGQQFSTIDRDNDGSASRHCAAVYHGAWWHNNCSQW
ncbi:hypothetical protein KR093_009019, partial [Drosophila rubida]